MVNNRQSQPHFQNWNIAFEISNIRKLTESNNFKKSLVIFDIVPGCQRFFFLLLYLAFIHFLVSSRTSLVKLSEIKKSMGSCTGFQNRHFTVSKDISTEYFIQMNKARLCCTFFLMVVYECSSHYFDFFCSMKKVLGKFCYIGESFFKPGFLPH